MREHNLILDMVFTRYRTLTICNVFFEQNKMATGGTRSVTTGDSVDVSCFSSDIENAFKLADSQS